MDFLQNEFPIYWNFFSDKDLDNNQSPSNFELNSNSVIIFNKTVNKQVLYDYYAIEDEESDENSDSHTTDFDKMIRKPQILKIIDLKTCELFDVGMEEQDILFKTENNFLSDEKAEEKNE